MVGVSMAMAQAAISVIRELRRTRYGNEAEHG
jgi:hypothetical protein